MPNFICPFTKSKCKETCEYWVPSTNNESLSNSNNLLGFIPLNFSLDDIIENISEKEFKNSKKYAWLFLLWRRWQRANNTSINVSQNLQSGTCSKLSNLNE